MTSWQVPALVTGMAAAEGSQGLKGSDHDIMKETVRWQSKVAVVCTWVDGRLRRLQDKVQA